MITSSKHNDFMPFISDETLLSYLPKVSMAYGENFGFTARDSASIELDKAGLLFNNRDIKELYLYISIGAEFLGYPLPPDNINDYISLIFATECCTTFSRLYRMLARQIYTGSTKNSVELWYKEFDGLDELSSSCVEVDKKNVLGFLIDKIKELTKNNIDFVIVTNEIAAKAVGLGDKLKVKISLLNDVDVKIIKDHRTPYNMISGGVFEHYIYIIPIVQGSQFVTFIEYLDYTKTLLQVNDDIFVTDNGLFLWQKETQKWDTKINVQTEMRLACKLPEYIIKIKFIDEPKWKEQ